MRLVIKETDTLCGEWTANYIVKKINSANPTKEKPFVLGLPTGSSPLPVYKALVKLYESNKISFKNVVTFNMDEYVGLPPEHPQSYHAFMWDNFFSKIDIPSENVHILNGMATDLEKECTEYEKQIASFGGIDLFLGGIGVDGHIAFNEPCSSLSSRTRVKSLMKETMQVNARFFDGDMSKVPSKALTVGVGTITDAREVVIIATGHNKARAVHYGVEEGINHMWTISQLQMHEHFILVCDDDATDELKVGTVKYFKDIEARGEN